MAHAQHRRPPWQVGMHEVVEMDDVRSQLALELSSHSPASARSSQGPASIRGGTWIRASVTLRQCASTCARCAAVSGLPRVARPLARPAAAAPRTAPGRRSRRRRSGPLSGGVLICAAVDGVDHFRHVLQSRGVAIERPARPQVAVPRYSQPARPTRPGLRPACVAACPRSARQ